MATIYRFKIQNSELNDEMVSFSLYHLHEAKEDIQNGMLLSLFQKVEPFWLKKDEPLIKLFLTFYKF